MKNDKVKAIKKQKTTTKIKEVESFLEFANFCKFFIKNFSHIAKPLNKLKSKKDQKWKKEHWKIFKELKKKILSQLKLTLPKREEKFRLETSLLEHTIKGVLFQEQKEK